MKEIDTFVIATSLQGTLTHMHSAGNLGQGRHTSLKLTTHNLADFYRNAMFDSPLHQALTEVTERKHVKPLIGIHDWLGQDRAAKHYCIDWLLEFWGSTEKIFMLASESWRSVFELNQSRFDIRPSRLANHGGNRSE